MTKLRYKDTTNPKLNLSLKGNHYKVIERLTKRDKKQSLTDHDKLLKTSVKRLNFGATTSCLEPGVYK